jgi:hypothetical protein
MSLPVNGPGVHRSVPPDLTVSRRRITSFLARRARRRVRRPFGGGSEGGEG